MNNGASMTDGSGARQKLGPGFYEA